MVLMVSFRDQRPCLGCQCKIYNILVESVNQILNPRGDFNRLSSASAMVKAAGSYIVEVGPAKPAQNGKPACGPEYRCVVIR